MAYTKEQRLMIVKDIASRMIDNDESVRNILGTKGYPSPSTFYMEWLPKYPELEAIYTRAKNAEAEVMDSDELQISDNKEDDYYEDDKGVKRPNPVAVQRAKLMLDTRKTLKAQRQPKKYGSKVDVTSDGEQIIPQINIGNLDLSAIKGLKK